MFNDYWMIDQGFIERDRKGDLRDLISRRHEESGTVTVSADDNLLIAYGRMKLYDISQLPVLDSDGKVVGIIDRSEEHTSELQSLMRNSYAVFFLKKKKKHKQTQH